MSWPLSQDYNEAIQSPASNFADADLKKGEAVANALGIPMPYSGNFADVYQVRCPDGSRWAVKCFTREAPGLRERYQEISVWLRKAKLPFTVDFSYLEQGIRVAGKWYPVLKMQWVEGLTLNQFVAQYLDKPAMLEALLQLWAKMGKYLRAAQVGHCDLQHGNVLLVPGSTPNALALKLIDYDGMWLPPLVGKKSGEVGHANFQHPRRLREGTYSLEVDRFPLLLVATAMRALKADKSLWAKYDNGDNLLFKESDLAAPGQSALFEELASLPDPGLVMLAAQVRAALKGSLESAALLDDVMPDARTTPSVLPTRPSRLAPASAAATAQKTVPAASAVAVAPGGESALDFDPTIRAPGSSFMKKGSVKKAASAGIPLATWIGSAVALVVVATAVGGLALWAMRGKTPIADTRIVQKDVVLPPPTEALPPIKADPEDDPPVVNPPDDPPVVAPPVVVKRPDQTPPGLPFDVGWDKPIDPDHDCKFLAGKNTLTVELPAKDHDLGAERGVMNAPRLLRDVAGDFTAQVRVGGDFSPVGPSTAAGHVPFVGAGLVVMVDDRTYLRLERAAAVYNGADKASPYVNLEWRVDGKIAPLVGTRPPIAEDKPTYLRLQRGNGQLLASVSQDGQKWSALPSLGLPLPSTVKVGLAAGTSSSAPFRPLYDAFQLTADKTAVAEKPAPAEKDLRKPPTGDDLAKEREAVKQEYKADYDKLTTPKDRSDLADKLRAAAVASKDKPDRQYALLIEARDLAARGDDFAASKRIIDETAAAFAIDPKEAKEAALLAAGATFSTKTAAKAYLAEAAPLLREARADDDYDRVAPLLPAVRKASTEAHDADMARTAASLEKLQKEFEAVKKDVQILKEKPDDPEANLAVGKFYSFQKQDWDKGGPLLAKSGNLALATAATKDADAPTDVAEQIALADSWMKLANGIGPGTRRRAYHWYTKALPNLSDKEEERVKVQVIELTKQFPEVLAAWENLDVSKVEAVGNAYLRMKRGEMLSTKQPVEGGIEIVLVARTAKAPPSFEFLKGKEPIVAWQVGYTGVTGRRPPAKGRSGMVTVRGTNFRFSPNVWVTYTCKLQDMKMDGLVDGKPYFFDTNKNDLSKPRTIQLLAGDQTLEIKSFTVNPLDKP
jgi:regulation of enolase protein 1 (concanavalin A-like superfamily)